MAELRRYSDAALAHRIFDVMKAFTPLGMERQENQVWAVEQTASPDRGWDCCLILKQT